MAEDWRKGNDGGADNIQGVTAAQNAVVAINDIVSAIRETFPNWQDVPANSTASGVAGQVAYNASFMYVCVSASSWRRVALSTF